MFYCRTETSTSSVHGYPLLIFKSLSLVKFKARFAHLCTVMSRMHHRREGYPFGSLVDFAPDSTGRKSIILHLLDWLFPFIMNILCCMVLDLGCLSMIQIRLVGD